MQGFGWAIAKALAEAGAEISLGVWVSTFLGFGASTALFSPQNNRACMCWLFDCQRG